MGTDGRDVLEVGGRLSSPPDRGLVDTAFASDLAAQGPLSDAIGLADLAHTVMLIETGTLPRAEGRPLLGALLDLQATPDGFAPDPAYGDVVTNRERWLSERTPATSWLGAGRARREATTVAYHLVLRRGLVELAADLVACADQVAHIAADHRQALMPDYTYLQAAQPTTFGHYILGFATPMLRDLERARALFERVDRSPAGCGSCNGSRLTQDRAQLAELLGFSGLVDHARDAMWQADGPIETMGVLVAIAVNLDRLAEDLMVFATAEFGFVELADGHARASKVMPQKKNPFALAYVRGSANRLIGLQAAMAAVGRTPTGQWDSRTQPYADVPGAVEQVRGAVALMRGVVGGLTFRPAAARAALDRAFVAATDLVEALVEHAGLGFRDAHRVVGRLARTLAEAGRAPASLTPQDLADAGSSALGRRVDLDARALADALDPARAVASRTCAGGAAPQRVAEMVVSLGERLGPHRVWVEGTRARLDAAQHRLLDHARALCGAS